MGSRHLQAAHSETHRSLRAGRREHGRDRLLRRRRVGGSAPWNPRTQPRGRWRSCQRGETCRRPLRGPRGWGVASGGQAGEDSRWGGEMGGWGEARSRPPTQSLHTTPSSSPPLQKTADLTASGPGGTIPQVRLQTLPPSHPARHSWRLAGACPPPRSGNNI